MAAVIAERDDTESALDLCQQAIEIFEQTGNVRGKAVTLHSMAGLTAQRGDYDSASDLCQQAIQIFEQTGYIIGKGATLNHMAWIAGKRGNVDEARRLYFKAAKSMAEAQAWLDLLAVLGNLSAIPIEGALGYLAQAVWLAISVEGPVEDALDLITRMLEKLGMEHEIAPLLATTAAFIAQTRGHHHPQQKSLVTYGFKMLVTCASVRNVEQLDKYKQWITSEGLKDPNRFLPALRTALESMVGEEDWLFDRKLIGELRNSS
jgi:tetratricopeptide (TPR) repeat protein